MSTSTDTTLVATVVRFCRALREHGVLVTSAETIAATRALLEIDLGDRDDVYLALRSVIATRPEDFAIFDALFARFWTVPNVRDTRGPQPRVLPEPAVPPPARAGAPMLERWAHPDDTARDDSRAGVRRPSDHDMLGTRDFRTFNESELRELTRVARRLARRLRMRPSRRWTAAARGPRVHLRRTLRGALGTGGVPIQLVYRARKPRRTRLVLLCDVSGSMDLYSRFLLQFLYALQHSFVRVETFVFATRLSRITEPLGAPGYRSALERIARAVRDWSGGTRIGACLDAFEADWARLVDRRTIVVILSDGWDTGRPEQLGDALRRLHRRAGRIIWLNPLLGSPGYQPLTRGMQAALPHVDVFHAAHNLASLEALVRHLSL